MVNGRREDSMDLTTIALEEVTPPIFQTVLRSWFAQRAQGGCPPVSEMKPFVAPSLAGHVLLIAVEDDNYTFRLVGERIREVVQEPLKGRNVRDVLGDTEYCRLVIAQFRLGVARCWPYYSVHHCLRPDDSAQVGAWRIALPYRQGERVTRLLTYQIFHRDMRIGEDIVAHDLLPRTVFWVADPEGNGPPPASTL